MVRQAVWLRMDRSAQALAWIELGNNKTQPLMDTPVCRKKNRKLRVVIMPKLLARIELGKRIRCSRNSQLKH